MTENIAEIAKKILQEQVSERTCKISAEDMLDASIVSTGNNWARISGDALIFQAYSLSDDISRKMFREIHDIFSKAKTPNDFAEEISCGVYDSGIKKYGWYLMRI